MSLPFGDSLTCMGQDATEHHFTGKEHDIESGDDYFLARYYGSTMGRFLSPDPSKLYYADPTNPQSLNLYAYARNNPLKFTDPTGMYCDYSDHSDPASGFDPSQFDYHSTQNECTAVDENGNRGQWVDDAYTHNGADDAGRPDDAVSSNTKSGSIPLRGDFSFNMTSGQFIAMMQQSGFQVSSLDTSLGKLHLGKLGFGHPGTNMRDSASYCSVHLNITPGSGANGGPVTGQFHFNEYNPLTFEPAPSGSPLDINGGGMQSTSNLVPHITEDVIPDLKIKAGTGTWTGNQNCPTS
jgi:RHS repeat-associated protein